MNFIDLNQQLISIAMPSYNHSNYISRAINSVLDQTYTNWELFIIDNNSTDGTDKVIDKFSDSRIKVIKIDNKGSIGVSRNKALELSNGKWLAFIDSDDWWNKEKLLQCSKLFDNNIDLIYHDMNIYFEISGNSTEHKIKSRKLKPPVIFDLIKNGNTIATSSVIVRTQILRKINGMSEDPNLIAIGDYHTWLKIAMISDKFEYLPYSLGTYRVHNHNVSKDFTEIIPTLAFRDFLQNLTPRQRQIVNEKHAYIKGRTYYKNFDYEKSISELKNVIKGGSTPDIIKSIWMLFQIQINKHLK